MFKSYKANERAGSTSVGEVQGKGTRCISAHVKPSGSAAAFQTDVVCWCSSYLVFLATHSQFSLDREPDSTCHCLDTSSLTSTGPASASIQTGRPDPSVCFLSLLPSLAMVRKGTCNSGNTTNKKQQLEFNPSIIYNVLMLSVHFRDFSQCCFRQPYSQSSFPKKQTTAIPTAVERLGPTPNLACCQILYVTYVISPPVFQLLHLQNWSSDSGLLCKVLHLNALHGS